MYLREQLVTKMHGFWLELASPPWGNVGVVPTFWNLLFSPFSFSRLGPYGEWKDSIHVNGRKVRCPGHVVAARPLKRPSGKEVILLVTGEVPADDLAEDDTSAHAFTVWLRGLRGGQWKRVGAFLPTNEASLTTAKYADGFDIRRSWVSAAGPRGEGAPLGYANHAEMLRVATLPSIKPDGSEISFLVAAQGVPDSAFFAGLQAAYPPESGEDLVYSPVRGTPQMYLATCRVTSNDDFAAFQGSVSYTLERLDGSEAGFYTHVYYDEAGAKRFVMLTDTESYAGLYGAPQVDTLPMRVGGPLYGNYAVPLYMDEKTVFYAQATSPTFGDDTTVEYILQTEGAFEQRFPHPAAVYAVNGRNCVGLAGEHYISLVRDPRTKTTCFSALVCPHQYLESWLLGMGLWVNRYAPDESYLEVLMEGDSPDHPPWIAVNYVSNGNLDALAGTDVGAPGDTLKAYFPLGCV